MKTLYNIINWSSQSPAEQQKLLARPICNHHEAQQKVAGILAAVRNFGDKAVLEFCRKFDGVELQTLAVSQADLGAATASIEPQLLRAIEGASQRISNFHALDIPKNHEMETAPGVQCEVRYQALSPVGLYIPGGNAPLISTVLMLGIPAKLAGCEQVVLCTPPDENGNVAKQILAAANLVGIDKIYALGGAQAIAAMAYGTETIPACNKIFGPGNTWVTEAKQQVSQDPRGAAIDMPAGPSEVLIIADRTAMNNRGAEFIAWDLLSQAEHGADSQVILLSDSQELAEAVIEQLEYLIKRAERRLILRRSLESARIILVDNLDTAINISESYAPEHLIINTQAPREIAKFIRNAGSVFLGRWTPESLGDYCSGTNHVLPTYGWARAYGALSCSDFMRRMTLQEASREGLKMIGSCAEILAESEGLHAHKMAISARLDYINNPGGNDN